LKTNAHEQVAGDISYFLVEQLKNQAFMIDLEESDLKEDSCTSNSDIFDKLLKIDFIISTPENCIEDIKQENKNLIKEIKKKDLRIEQLLKKNSKKGK
jgi:hypothetical protein